MSIHDINLAEKGSAVDYDALIALLDKSDEYFAKVANETRGANAPQQKPYKFKPEVFNDSLVLYIKGKDGKPVACLMLTHWNWETPVVVLGNLWVEPEYRRMGYARRLVETAMEMIHKDGRHAEIAILAGNVGASAFWYSIMPDMVKMHTYFYIP